MLNIVKFVILSIIYLDISLVIANDEIEELDVKIENNKHLSKKYTNQITNYNLKIKSFRKLPHWLNLRSHLL